MADWQNIKHHYAFSEDRFTPGWRETVRQFINEGKLVTINIPGGFDEPRQLLGEEEVCVSYYTQPELIHDILDTIADTACRVLDRVTAEVPVDMLFVHEDMAGKSGPLAGPVQVEEFIVPYYRKTWDLVHSRGTRLFNQDSDGDMRAVIPAFLKSGLNVIHPCEPGSGMDIVKLRAEYGNALAFEGGIDKYVLAKDEAAITAELEYKLPPMIKSGACMLGLDHRIPNGTSIANYRFYVNKVWELIGRA